jgi:hypothetical protein
MELVFYPSAFPLRALVKTRQEAVLLSKSPPGQTIAGAIAAYHKAFTACPWLEQFPVLLQSVMPMRAGEGWLIQDTQGYILPLSSRLEPKQGWQLLALSGGSPVSLFGEWDGTHLLPLTVWVEERFYGLG